MPPKRSSSERMQELRCFVEIILDDARKSTQPIERPYIAYFTFGVDAGVIIKRAARVVARFTI